ncbi:multidrug ABC transporter permease [Actinokineospora bangkokensis]|uniref:Transport permease protein n=2 Tax=Actinokineospora bangkokensis TaxID=1193682 RepID=A0A1Q9LJT2_9PSEU|nr:multidrug ABC transporter permease [Actinokineospora bangkokensis]
MVARSVRLSLRTVDALLTSLLLPVVLMLVTVFLFGGAIDVGVPYVTYVVPGVLVLCAGLGSALTAVSVCNDMTGGIIDRFRSMDVGATAILAGHVAASAARNAISMVLVVGVAFAIGFRTDAGLLRWLGAAGILLLFVVAVSWVAAALGMVVRSPEAASGFTFWVMFLPYPSSAFVPIETMPGWVHGFASWQPVTPVVESLRGFLGGVPLEGNPWMAITWSTGLLLLAVGASVLLFRRRTR